MLSTWSPPTLAKLAVASSILYSSRILVPCLMLVAAWLHGGFVGFRASHRVSVAYYALCLILVSIPSLLGQVLLILAKRRISEGLDQKRWPEQETEHALGWLNSPAVRRSPWAVFWSMFACFVACLSVPRLGYHSNVFQFSTDVVIVSAMFTPSPRDYLTQIRAKMQPELPPFDPSQSWTAGMKRLSSEGWGGREIAKGGRSEA